MAYRCMHDEAGFLATAAENHIDDMGIVEIKNELSIASRNEETVKLEEELEAIAMLADRDKALYNKKIKELIFKWKEDYRRICRV